MLTPVLRLPRRLLLLGVIGLAACKRTYRVGEFVLVQWEDAVYPAYITELKSNGRFRVHYDGYDPRWDEDVGPERIVGLAQQPLIRPPPPEKVRRAQGTPAKAGSGLPIPAAPYVPGDKVRVKWRGSVYAATVVEVVANDKFKVHYEGYESAWDEVVILERIVAKRP